MTDFAPAVFLFVVMLAVLGLRRKPYKRAACEYCGMVHGSQCFDALADSIQNQQLKRIKWKDVDGPGPLPPVSVYPRTRLSTRLKRK